MSAWTPELLRSDIPVTRRKAYLNTGTLGPSPQTATVAFIRAYQQWQMEGPGWPEAYLRRRAGVDRARAAVARLLGVPADDIALAANVTEAVNWVAAGLPLAPGDEVIVSTEEHPANRYPWRALEAMRGVRVVPWRLPPDDRDLVPSLERLLTRRTRLVAVSHVLQTSGRLLPVHDIARAAHAAGALVLVDGAQSVGQLPVHVPDTGADFYAWNGHKWLLGPVGTAGLYVRPEVAPNLGLLPAGSGSAASDLEGRTDPDVSWLPSVRRFEVGTKNWPLFDGLAAAVEIVAAIGVEAIAARSATLAQAFLDGLPAGIEVVSVPRRVGMVTVRVPGLSTEAVVDGLYEIGRVVVRGVHEYPPGSVRFSFAVFNNEADVAAAQAALEQLLARR